MMRILVIAALITLSSASAPACGKATNGTQSSPSTPPPANTATATPQTTPTPAPRNVLQLCSGLSWPRPMPAVVGLILDDQSSELQPLTCLNDVRGIRPDGRVIQPHRQFNGGWPDRITAVSPQRGTLVGADDTVTVNLVPIEATEQPAYHPCDWVTAAEATGFVGGTPMVSSPRGQNVTGTTDLQCEYFDRPDDNHRVVSELRLTGAHIVDAASEFAFKTGENSTSVSGVGIKAACTWPERNYSSTERQFYVLLPGERIYVATGRHGESCDTLKQFAQAAIPRIGA
jgi:hypothetical protein